MSFINPECEECNLHLHRTQVVGHRGSTNTSIMVVAEAPGQHEDDLGIPLIGISGQMLERVLNSVGINSQDCYITNVCKCRPLDNRKPTKIEIKTCTKLYLHKEIVQVKPKYLISLGSTAYYAITGKDPSMRSIVGNFSTQVVVHEEVSHEFELVVLYHPSYLLRINGMDIGSPKHQTWKTMIELKEKLNENKK